jgi:hypothetical protein
MRWGPGYRFGDDVALYGWGVVIGSAVALGTEAEWGKMLWFPLLLAFGVLLGAWITDWAVWKRDAPELIDPFDKTQRFRTYVESTGRPITWYRRHLRCLVGLHKNVERGCCGSYWKLCLRCGHETHEA